MLSKLIKGFTLIELLIVAGIILILLTVGIINGKKYYLKFKFQQYEQSLISFSKLAKLLAKEKSHNIAVCVSGREIRIVDIGTSRRFTCSGTVLNSIRIEEPQISISGSGFAFDPRGISIRGGNICLYFSLENRYVKAVASRFGAVRVERGNGTC